MYNIYMTTTARTTFQDELLKLNSLVLDLAYKVRNNCELLLEVLENKKDIHEIFPEIKIKDKEINEARWQLHDFGDQLIVLQQPVAKDFRQIMTSIQIADNLERIGDHFKKTARLLEKADLRETEVPEEIISMARFGLRMLSESTSAYSNIFEGKTNEVALIDDEVDELYKKTIKKVISMLKNAPEDKIDGFSKLFFIARSFERAADHAAKIGHLVNFAVTGKRDK